MLAGGHAPNALPQRALANINCRIFPGHPPEEIRQQLTKLFNDPGVSVSYKSADGTVSDHAPDAQAMAVPPLRDDVMKSLNKVSQAMWPGATVVPRMEVGASDSVHTMAAGIPSYGICGLDINRHDDRMHGRDERIGVESYYNGLTFYYLLLKDLTSK
jgi:acetylornithine deacetylase/succinyl-diaminopimelate desuccinylase-like protein